MFHGRELEGSNAFQAQAGSTGERVKDALMVQTPVSLTSWFRPVASAGWVNPTLICERLDGFHPPCFASRRVRYRGPFG